MCFFVIIKEAYLKEHEFPGLEKNNHELAESHSFLLKSEYYILLGVIEHKKKCKNIEIIINYIIIVLLLSLFNFTRVLQNN